MKDKALLNFDFIPTWTIPFRFFVTAPLFAMLAGLVLMVLGFQVLSVPESLLWQSRWFSHVIYALHLVTLGTITMVMIGALYQVTSVVGGSLLPGGNLGVWFIHSGLIGGALLFLLALLSQLGWLFALAGLLLFSALLVLAIFGLIAISRAQRGSATLNAMRLSLISLLVMVSIGVWLLLMHGYPELLGFDRRWTDIHLTFAVAGWVGLLIVGVSFQVIPMFHVTPSFNGPLQRWLPGMIFTTMLCVGLSQFSTSSTAASFANVLLLICYGVYGAAVLILLTKRKRKIQDFTVLFWRKAAFCLLLFVIMQLCIQSGLVDTRSLVGVKGLVAITTDSAWLFSGVLLVFGVILSVIEGMLLKIIPFLSYLHMQRFCKGDFNAMKSLPHMRAILKIKHAKALYWLHIVSLILLLSMVFMPFMTFVAGLSLLAEFSLLFFIALRVVGMIKQVQAYSSLASNDCR